MSTTTTYTPDVAGSDEVHALIEAGATEKQAVAVYLRDHGLTNAEGGDAFGSIYGTPIKSGGFGNLVVNGLRAVGREDEIASGTGGGSTRRVRVRSLADLIEAERARVHAERERLEKAVSEAETALSGIEAEVLVNERLEAIDEQVRALNAEKKALKADPTPLVDAERERRQATLDRARTAHAEGIEAIEQAEAELAAVAK